MPRRRSDRSLAAAIIGLVAIVGGCASQASPSPGTSSPTFSSSARASGQAPSASPLAAVPSPIPDPRFKGFELCAVQGFIPKTWLCDTIDVPLDRQDPSAGTLAIAVYALPHTDLTTPPGPPLFTTPGGPGGNGYANYGLYSMQDELHAHHDIVTVDPRGTGLSDPIVCPELQDGNSTHDEIIADVRACIVTLDGRTDRYGAADRAMDMEVVRETLGYDAIDYLGPSYGSVDAQAYAVRFPDRLHALVLDSGFRMEGPAAWAAAEIPTAWFSIAALDCRRDPLCQGLTPDPGAALRVMLTRVQQKPVVGRSSTGGSSSAKVVVDAPAVGSLLTTEGITSDLVRAAVHLSKGDSQPLVDLSAEHPLFAPNPDSDPASFSNGANVAGSCNDLEVPWDPMDPPAARRKAYDTALAALADTIAPVSTETWGTAGFLDLCLDWPAPTHFEPVIPEGSVFPDVPTLLLSGDLDRGVPAAMSKLLLQEFPKAVFVTIEGAGHPTMSAGDCPSRIAASFIETLQVGDISCAGAQ